MRVDVICKKAKNALKKVHEEELQEEVESKKKEKLFKKYDKFASNEICPACGKTDLKDPEEVHVGINGEFGGAYCWIKCSCGFIYMGGDIEDDVTKIDGYIKWFQGLELEISSIGKHRNIFQRIIDWFID